MIKEEAIQILIESKDETIERTMQEWDKYDKKFYQAIDMAIEALKTESSAEGKYEKAIKTLREMPNYLNGIKAKQIKKISADTVQGEWIDKGEYAECSICGAYSGIQFDGVEPIPLKSNFCSNCGAKMIGNEKKKENNNTHKAPLYAYTSWDRSEE